MRGNCNPRALSSRSTPNHDSLLSRSPASHASSTFCPSDSAPTITSSAALRSAIPAFTYSPSAHQYTSSSCDKSPCFHCSYSACHMPLSRCSDVADSGAPSPNSPRKASSKSPLDSPCKYSRGSSSPSSWLRRLNSGSTRLAKRSPRSLIRGRRTTASFPDELCLVRRPKPSRCLVALMPEAPEGEQHPAPV